MIPIHQVLKTHFDAINKENYESQENKLPFEAPIQVTKSSNMSHQLQSDPETRQAPFKSVCKERWLLFSSEQKIKN